MSKRKSTPQTPESPAVKKSDNSLIIYAVIFIAGFLSGIAFTIYKSSDTVAVPVANQQQEHEHDTETSQALLNLEAEVTANPDNFQTWVQLGNLYFDTNQPEKAITAYNKSLDLHSGNANIFTDLGVMYRRANQPKKAIEAFNKAIALDSSHLPSRFNKGIVLMYDLDDAKGAITSWESILAIDPDARTGSGETVRDFITQMKKELADKK
ncbi:tetratricopeptide repeat protein [Desulforhopalus sp. IMCC35007]|uniref:tetratricopeptide repeat protein n=1 Tax=Desulforhopalus sp. IMCC35007 TaxID=2569543 RepID=UPI0010AE0B80|nr:tetratricopeptide repeat protein [Desulforhopalus sp. IMCC35007]TKB10852.1 tetratricopeptide repeat protein [Desulforhopalus sp. IMCC35007]